MKFRRVLVARESTLSNSLSTDRIHSSLDSRLLACDHENVRPDVLVLGKALAGGFYPVIDRVSTFAYDRDSVAGVRRVRQQRTDECLSTRYAWVDLRRESIGRPHCHYLSQSNEEGSRESTELVYPSLRFSSKRK